MPTAKRRINITVDNDVYEALERLAGDARSAVIRRAVQEYLRRRRRSRIAAAYRRGYGRHPASELEGWAGEGAWPEE